jgi:hypothetical protein
VPGTAHAKVAVEDGAAVEVEEQVLSAALDALQHAAVDPVDG